MKEKLIGKYQEYLKNLNKNYKTPGASWSSFYQELRFHIITHTPSLVPHKDDFFEAIFDSQFIDELFDHDEIVEKSAWAWKIYKDVVGAQGGAGFSESFEVFTKYLEEIREFFINKLKEE